MPKSLVELAADGQLDAGWAQALAPVAPLVAELGEEFKQLGGVELAVGGVAGADPLDECLRCVGDEHDPVCHRRGRAAGRAGG